MLKGETTTAAGGTCTAPTETCCGRHIRACPSPTSMGTPHAAPSTLWPYGDRQDRRLRWATPWREPLPGWSRGQAAAAAGAARGEGGGGVRRDGTASGCPTAQPVRSFGLPQLVTSAAGRRAGLPMRLKVPPRRNRRPSHPVAWTTASLLPTPSTSMSSSRTLTPSRGR